MPRLFWVAGPVLGQVVAGVDGEGLAVGLDRLVQPPLTLRTAQPLAQGPEREAQVVLGPGPVLGQVVAGVDGEGLAVGLDRLVQPPQTLRPPQPLAQGRERDAQVVLGPGPVLGQVVAGADGEGLAVGLHRLVQPPQTLRTPLTARPGPRARVPRLFWVLAQSWGRSSRVETVRAWR